MWKPGHVGMLVHNQVQFGSLREQSSSFKITASKFRGRARINKVRYVNGT